MQMYLVEYETALPDVLEVGRVIVCAASNEQAISLALMAANVQPSATTASATRVKPSVYQLSKKEVPRPTANPRSFSATTEKPQQFVLSVRADIVAYYEGQAWRRLAAAIVERASSNKPVSEKWLNDMVMDVERAATLPKPAAIAKQEIYTHHQFFAGGASRPR